MNPLFRKMTWPEVRESAKARRVVLLPVAAIEQHGYHLPVDMDNLAVETICEDAAKRNPELVVCAPVIHYGFNEHNMDFPGTISVSPQSFVNYCIDVAHSFSRQHFERILLVNGHASNGHLLESVARQVTLKGPAKCASVSYWDLIVEEFERIRESEYPGGANHAGEFETSIYLHVEPDGVQRDKMIRDMRSRTKFFYEDLMGGPAVRFTDWRSIQTNSGVGGDPGLATAEKGKTIVEAAIKTILDLAAEFRDLNFGQRTDLTH
jgi:creatinine amidohydrolase